MDTNTVLPLQGCKVVKVEGAEVGSDCMQIWYETPNAELHNILFFHEQDCCESVQIVDMEGDPDDLVGHVLGIAEERTREVTTPQEVHESGTWTFYEFCGSGGSLWVRWLGESNGYYSECVSWRVKNN